MSEVTVWNSNDLLNGLKDSGFWIFVSLMLMIESAGTVVDVLTVVVVVVFKVEVCSYLPSISLSILFPKPIEAVSIFR